MFITDENRSFFSVIVPIHNAFTNDSHEESDSVKIKVKKKKTKEETKKLILKQLSKNNYSSNELYRRLGYSGNASKTFRTCVDELICDNQIYYATDNKQSSNNVLIKK